MADVWTIEVVDEDGKEFKVEMDTEGGFKIINDERGLSVNEVRKIFTVVELMNDLRYKKMENSKQP